MISQLVAWGLAVLGAVGSVPSLVSIWRWVRYEGVRVDGQWQCEWIDGNNILHHNFTDIRQMGPHVRMYAHNEWDDRFSGDITDGNLLQGTWRSRKPGVRNMGVFMLRIKGAQRPEMEGFFIGLDDEGEKLEVMRGKLLKV